MILILTVTGPEKRLPIIAAASVFVCVFVDGHTQQSIRNVCMWVSIKSIRRLFFPSTLQKFLLIRCNRPTISCSKEQLKKNNKKNKQSLFTRAKTSLPLKTRQTDMNMLWTQQTRSFNSPALTGTDSIRLFPHADVMSAHVWSVFNACI